MRGRATQRRGDSGFTLLEVLAGLALASMILVSLNLAMSAVTKGADRTRQRLGQQTEIATALDIFARDVTRIAWIRKDAGPAPQAFLFEGGPGRISYVLREDDGVNAPGLYLVRLSILTEKGQTRLLRERAKLKPGARSFEGAPWADAVELMSGPYALAFAYRAPRDGARGWSDSWSAAEAMPQRIRLTITDPATGKLRVPGFVQSLAVEGEI